MTIGELGKVIIEYLTVIKKVVAKLFNSKVKYEKIEIGNLSFDEFKEAMFARGLKIIKGEIENGVKIVLDIDNDKRIKRDLRPDELLSDIISLDSDLPARVKDAVLERKKRIKIFLLGISNEIEDNNFKSAEELVEKVNWMNHQKNLVRRIISGQKKINFSFRTLEVVIEIFKRYNNELLNKIQSIDDPQKNISLRIENALLTYELLDFAYREIESFSLAGLEELNNVKAQIFTDIKTGIQEDEKILVDIGNVSDKTKETVIRNIESRRKIWELVERKWENIDNKVKNIQKEVGSIKKILPDLLIYKRDAKAHLRALSLVAIMNIVEQNLSLIEKFADMDWDMLAPFEPEDYLELIGENIR